MITCSFCRRQTNPDFDTEICWGCGKSLPVARPAQISGVQKQIEIDSSGRSKTINASHRQDVGGWIVGVILLTAIFAPLVYFMALKPPKVTNDELAAGGPMVPHAEIKRLSVRKRNLTQEFEESTETCEKGSQIIDMDGQLAMAEFDIAHAESIPSMSLEQEWRTRAAIGAEMGLAPSQVDGWKSILEGRARQARAKIEAAELDADLRTKSACRRRERLERELQELEISISKMKLGLPRS